jgi:DNA-binding transcriptional regulator YiaG
MPNIASVLKTEVARVARKEVRGELDSLKKASSQYRANLAALKRQVVALERQLKQLSRGVRRHTPEAPEAREGTIRYSAKRLAAHRAKLGLSAKDYGALIGVSALSIYKWEGGEVRPREKQLQAIAAVRRLGKREAAARLDQMEQ